MSLLPRTDSRTARMHLPCTVRPRVQTLVLKDTLAWLGESFRPGASLSIAWSGERTGSERGQQAFVCSSLPGLPPSVDFVPGKPWAGQANQNLKDHRCSFSPPGALYYGSKVAPGSIPSWASPMPTQMVPMPVKSSPVLEMTPPHVMRGKGLGLP